MCGVEAFGGPHLVALQLVLALVTMVTFPICLVEFIAMAYLTIDILVTVTRQMYAPCCVKNISLSLCCVISYQMVKKKKNQYTFIGSMNEFTKRTLFKLTHRKKLRRIINRFFRRFIV